MRPIGSPGSNIRRAIAFISHSFCCTGRALRTPTITWTTACRQTHRTTTPGADEARGAQVRPLIDDQGPDLIIESRSAGDLTLLRIDRSEVLDHREAAAL